MNSLKVRYIWPGKCYRYIKGCNGKAKRVNWCLFGSTVLFLSIISFRGILLSAGERSENGTQKAVESFLQQLANDKITRAEVYYYSWNAFTRAAITEDRLRTQSWHYKIIVAATRFSPPSAIDKSLREFNYKIVETSPHDFRLGCVFYAGEQEILRLFFPRAPIVAINGKPFKATPQLLIAIMQFLPFETYQEVQEGMIRNWASLPLEFSQVTREPNKP